MSYTVSVYLRWHAEPEQIQVSESVQCFLCQNKVVVWLNCDQQINSCFVCLMVIMYDKVWSMLVMTAEAACSQQ